MSNPYYTPGVLSAHIVARASLFMAEYTKIGLAFDGLNTDLNNMGSATSTSSIVVGTGSKSLTITGGRFLQIGQTILIARTSAPSTVQMVGTITTWSVTTGEATVSVTYSLGGGTFTDWTISITPSGTSFITDNGVVTLTNKTINLASNTVTGTKAQFDAACSDANFLAETDPHPVGTIVQTTFAIVDVAGVAINPRNGSMQTWTLGANRVPTSGTWNNGDEITLLVAYAGFTVDWTTLAVTWIGSTAPVQPPTGYADIRLKKVGGTIFGTNLTPPVIANYDQQLVGYTSTSGVGSASAQAPSISLTALTGGIAPIAAAGDTVYVFVAVSTLVGDLNLAMTTAGYTELADLWPGGTAYANLGVYRKRLSGTPDTIAQASIPANVATGSYAMIAMVFRGVDSTNPEALATATNDISGIPVPPSVTPTLSGELVLVAGMVSRGTHGAQTLSASYCSTFISVNSIGSSRDTTLGVGIAVRGPLAAYNPAAFVLSEADSTGFQNCSATISLRRQQ